MKNKTLGRKLGLYKEGILQTKVIGIPYACLGVLMMIFELLEELFGSEMIKGPGIAAVMMLIAGVVATPLMLLMLFNFLNSRKASDFYHAMPRSRAALYLSFGAAAVTWPIVIVTAITVIEMLTYTIFGFQLDWVNWLQVLVATLSVNILIAGSVLIAISISSTVFSQIVVSGLFFFLPRVLLMCFEKTVTNIVPILPSFEQSVGIIGSPKANILLGLLFYGMNNEAVWQSAIYSIFVGLAYAAAGLFFFVRRKSEAAAEPALNRWVQTAVRVIIAFVICLIPTVNLSMELNKGVPLTYVGDLPLMLVLYGVAVIAYFVYEAISTRSIRGMWRSWRELLIGLAVLIALNLAFFFGANLSAKAVLSFRPENDEVASISFPVEDDYSSFSELRIAETEITEEAITEFFANQMRKNVDDIRVINESRYVYSDEMFDYGLYSNQMLVQFTLENGRTVTRNVYMSEPESLAIYDMLLSNSDYVEAAIDMPESYYDLSLLSNVNGNELTAEQLEELYRTYAAEVPSANPEDIITNSVFCISEICVRGRYNGREYDSYYPIYLGTPESLKLYIELTKSEETLTEVLKKAENASYYNLGVAGYNFYNDGNYHEFCGHSYDFYKDYYSDDSFNGFEATHTSVTSYSGEGVTVAVDREIYEYGFLYSQEMREKVLAELKANESKPVDITKPFYVVSISIEQVLSEDEIPEDGEMYIYEDYEFFIQAAEEGSCLEMPEFVYEEEYMYGEG